MSHIKFADNEKHKQKDEKTPVTQNWLLKIMMKLNPFLKFE